MKKILLISVAFVALSFVCVYSSAAQTPTPTPGSPTSGPTPDLERRLSEAESRITILNDKQESVLLTTKERIEQLQTILSWSIAVFVVFSGVAGGIVAVAAWRQARQQQDITGVGIRSAERVSDVLDVVDKILRSRLLQVDQARNDISTLRQDLQNMNSIVGQLKAGIDSQRKKLESRAMELAQISRHDFKKPTNIAALNAFAQDYDRFNEMYPEERALVRECLFSRGIAAAFSDDFEILQSCLREVIADMPDVRDIQYAERKRIASACYYLGLNHSNLGESDDAIRLLEQAHRLDSSHTDFLTRLVMAEVYAMLDQYDQAELLLQEVEAGLDAELRKNGRLESHQLRKLSHAHLVRSNLAILARADNWAARARQAADEAHRIDREHYYAAFTLGQILHEIDEEAHEASVQELFRDAYASIQHSGHLHFVKETRTRILLLMVAALCAKHGKVEGERVVNNYLDEAQSLRSDLPRIGSRVCTVFSPLTKRNVDSETIGAHIEGIRQGTWSLSSMQGQRML